MSSKYSRKQFFRKLLSPGPNKWEAEQAETTGSGENGSDEVDDDSQALATLSGRPWIRPPGALTDEDAFLTACSRCGDCAGACPQDCIQALDLDAGPAEHSPFIVPEEKACKWCVDMPCISACETGALKMPAEGQVPPIATARLNLGDCLTFRGIMCDDCYVACPSTVGAIKMVNRRPNLNPELCVGCGLCLYYCDASPDPIELTAL